MKRLLARVIPFILFLAVSCLSSSLFFGAVTSAAVNNQISFQGKLVNSDGTNVTNNNYSIRFRIYTDPSADAANPCIANSCVWEETQVSVPVTDGTFYVALGSVTSLSSVDFNNSGLYLGVKVGSDAEMTPRIRFTSSPYALNSQNSQALNGLTSGNFVQLGQGLQVDSSATNASIAINKTAGSGNIVDLQHAGNSAFVLGNNGSADFFDSSGAISLLSTAAAAGSVTTGNGTVTVTADGSITRNIGAGKTATNNLNSGSQSQFLAAGSQTNDLVVIDNTGQEPTVDNANGEHITYGGGNAAVQGAGLRIDYKPGSTSGGTWNGVRIVAAASGAAAGVNSYGLQLEGPTSSNGGNDTAIKIASGWDIGLDIGSGGLQLATQANPSAPAAGNLKVYAKTISGRTMLKAMGPSGVDYPLQPSLFQNQVSVINVQSGTASNFFGTNRATAGTGVNAAFSEAYGYMGGWSTGTTANTSSGIASNAGQFARGSVAGANGFFMNIRGALQDASYGSGATGTRMFIGMTDQTIATSVASQNPAGNRVGFSYDTGRGDTNWMVSTKNGGTETLANTGMVFSPAKAYDWYVYVPPYPNNSTIYWRIDNVTDDTTAEGSTGATLPTGSVALRAGQSIRNLSAVARTISYQRIYVESDR
jgi:hypothetical protein